MKPIFDSKEIKATLLRELNTARNSIEIAMAWFTDTALAEALAKAVQRKVKVSVLLHNDATNRSSRIDWDALNTAGVSLHWHTPEKGTMHNKFCVIDKQKVLFGTYNWTFSAENFNKESLIFIEEEATANDFRSEFSVLIQDANTQPHTLHTVAYTYTEDLAVHPEIGRMRVAIMFLETEIADLEAACAHYRQLKSRYLLRLQIALSDLLLQQISLQKAIAEAQAVRTQKKVYQEEAEKWEKTYTNTQNTLKEAQKEPEIDKDTQQALTKMYRETLLKIHPDRYDNEPEKRDIVTQLTQELVEAYKKSNFGRVKEIWERVKEGWIFVEDIITSSNFDVLRSLLSKLQEKRNRLEAEWLSLQEDNLLKAAENESDFEHYITESREQLIKNIEQLKITLVNLHK